MFANSVVSWVGGVSIGIQREERVRKGWIIRSSGGTEGTHPERLVRQLRNSHGVAGRTRRARREPRGLRVVHVRCSLSAHPISTVPHPPIGGRLTLMIRTVEVLAVPARREVVLRHDAALARLLWEVVDLGEARVLVVEAREAQALVFCHAVFALGGAADRHAEALVVSLEFHPSNRILG